MTSHNIYTVYCINRDIAEISPSLLLTIILIKNIQLRVARQAFEVSIYTNSNSNILLTSNELGSYHTSYIYLNDKLSILQLYLY